MRRAATLLLRRALAGALLALSIGASGCAPVIVVRGVSCLNGPVPHVGREVPDEMFALLRRERARAAQASPLVRARILEAIPALFPDVSDLWPEPPCHDELEREGTDALEATPLVVDRELIARIRAVHDASSLIGLALRDEGTIADYRLGPDEPGPAPTKTFLGYRALANIPSYWFADNRVDGRRLLLDRLRVGTDATEVLLLHGAAEAIFDQSLFGHPEKAAGTDGPMLLGGFIADVGKRLQEPPDRAALELVLLRLGDIGRFGVRFDHESAARGVVRTVLSAKGEVHLTRGVPGAARDLAEAARGALFDLDTPQRSIGYTDLSPPRRKRFDPRADWLDREPAGGSPSPVDRAARVRDLDLELGAVTHNAPRCYLIRQLGEWLSDAEAEARFEAMIAPAFEGERVVLSTESLCRLNVALGMEGVSADRRAALAARLLRTPLPKPGSRDLTLDEHGPAIGHPWDEDPVRQSAAAALNRHPEWVDTSTDIRSWLEEKAREPIPRDHPPAQTWSVLNASFERAMDFHLSGGPEAHPETARGILAAWIGSIRAALLEKPASHIYYGEVVQRRIHTLGELGRRAGMVPEIGAFLEDLKGRRDAVIARYLLDLETPAGK